MSSLLPGPTPGALHTHVAGWAEFVAVVAQGWGGLNQTSGRRGPLSLRAPIHSAIHSALRGAPHGALHGALLVFEGCAAC